MVAQNWGLFLGFGVTKKPCFESSHRSNVKDDVIANFQFQRLGSYWQKVTVCKFANIE